MKYIPRHLSHRIQYALDRDKSVLLLGARQTGKTTLLKQFKTDISFSLVKPSTRQRYEQQPELLTGELEALAEQKKRKLIVWIDEVQKVPALLDAIQDLIDRDIALFLLTGSSARRLRRHTATNWLPGRLVVLRLDPLMHTELFQAGYSPSLQEIVCDGTLPGIVTLRTPEDRTTDLSSYISTYLEEEIRSEALVKKLGDFSKFLMLAASESGHVVNFRKLSQEIGIAHTTVAAYYQILEDCLIAERVEPLTSSKTRRRLSKTPRYLFFDLGIRRLSAREGQSLPQAYWGVLFEQWVGLELIRYLRSTDHKGTLYFWRDLNGPEVDWVIKIDNTYLPIEVKWTDKPRYQDAKHLIAFKKEYPTQKGWIICQTPQTVKLADSIYACSWETCLHSIFSSLD